MSYKYYKVYRKKGTCTFSSHIYTPYNIWRGFKNRKLDVFDYTTNKFLDTGWKDMTQIVSFSKWYLKYEKISKQEAYEYIDKLKMLEELKK